MRLRIAPSIWGVLEAELLIPILTLAGILLLGCSAKPLPGQPMGDYLMTATEGQRLWDAGSGELGDSAECGLKEITGADLSFEMTLTGDPTSQRAWLTLGGPFPRPFYSRQSTFDGQVLTSEGEASRTFVDCSQCSTRLAERLAVAVLSRSQLEASGGRCPPHALDGGVPRPNPDAGISGPSQTPQGYDAVRLCGELSTVVIAEGLADGGACEPQCQGCPVLYQLRGERR